MKTDALLKTLILQNLSLSEFFIRMYVTTYKGWNLIRTSDRSKEMFMAYSA